MAKKRRPKSKNYFTHDTELAIVRYNNEPNPEVRSKIYEDEIHYPFFKLTENIIHTFKFYYTEVDHIEDLQHEVITFLLSKIHLFNPEKVLIGSPLNSAKEILHPAIMSCIQQQSLPSYSENIKLEPTEFYNKGTMPGAALVKDALYNGSLLITLLQG